jgi:uncharacterized protein (DUF1501 family)
MTMDESHAGCGEFAVSRRSLLKTAGLAGLAGVTTTMFGDVLSSTVFGAENANVLVVLSLRGGVDGLSMVVPHAEQAYYDVRPNIAVPKASLLHADSTFGLHPAFAPLTPMWTAGRFAAIQAVGLPAPNRSHFEAMELIEDADPGSSARVGWINRMVSALAVDDDPFGAVQLGTPVTPTSLIGPAPSLATTNFRELQVPFATNAALRTKVTQGLQGMYAPRTDVLGTAATSAFDISDRSVGIASFNAGGPANGATYPGGELGAALANAAGLIRQGVGVRAVALDHGSWDHHVGLASSMQSMISTLAGSLAAFFTDLGSHGDRVTVVTLSEFGRRLHQNGAGGADHGYGNAVLALGAGVAGGAYYGAWPTLAQGSQVDGDLAVTTDYRNVIAEILKARFPSVSTPAVFPGVTYAPVGFMA